MHAAPMDNEPVPTSESDPRRLAAAPSGRLLASVLAVCTFGFAFDLMELGLSNALVAVFSAPPHRMPAASLSWLLASVYIGAVIGAPAFGFAADRWGRRNTLCAVLLVLSATALWAAASRDIRELTLARVASGLALGAYPPLVIAYLTDLLPARRRGGLILGMCALAALGAPLGALLVRALTPLQPWGLEGWRVVFVLGAAGTSVAAAAMLLLPQSAPRAPVHRSRGETGRPPLAPLFGLSFLSPWATVSFPMLMGTMLIAKGFALSDALLMVALSTCGPAAMLLLAPVCDRIMRRSLLRGTALAMSFAGFAFVVTEEPAALIIAGFVFMVAAGLYVPTLNVYLAELVPMDTRASRVSSAWALNRVSAAVAPLLLVPLLKNQGALVMFTLVAGALACSVLLLWRAPPGRAGADAN